MKRSDFWNWFHDSQLTGVCEEGPEQLRIDMACAHLAPEFEPGSRSLVVRLYGCCRSGFEDESGSIPLVEALKDSEIEIFFATDVQDEVHLFGVVGHLRLAYRQSQVQTESGRLISPEEWESSALNYWKRLLFPQPTSMVSAPPAVLQSTVLQDPDEQSSRWSKLVQAWLTVIRERIRALGA